MNNKLKDGPFIQILFWCLRVFVIGGQDYSHSHIQIKLKARIGQDYNRVMFNFDTMFSRANDSNNLSDLLATPNVSLMRLLDEDSFLSDFRSSSYAIRAYMTYKKYAQLVQLITQVGDPFDKKRSFKFPLTAADLLASETPLVLQMLLPEEGLVQEQEEVISSEEKEIEQQVDDDDDDSEQDVGAEQESKEKEEGKGEGQQQEFGEFVSAPAPRKKIIKAKEVVQTVSIVNHSYPPLVETIFSYFGNEINYTLTSYCCKVLTSLLNKRTTRFLSKFFSEEKNRTNLLKHIGSRSTVQLIVRIFTIQTTDQLDQRISFFKQLLKQSSLLHEMDTLSNISAALCQTFEKLTAHFKTMAPCKELQAYFNTIPQFLAQSINNIIGESETVSVYSAPFIYQLLNCLPAEIDNITIDDLLARFVQGAIKKLEEAVISSKRRLGVGRVKMIEVLNFILKRQKVRQLLSERKDFFPLLYSVVKKYPLNNILHNQTFKLIAACLVSETAELADNLFSGESLIEWLSEQAELEGQRGEQSPKSPRGYAGHLVNLCKLIRETNSLPSSKFKDQRFEQAAKVLVDKVVDSHQKSLGGYAMRKTGKFPILFTKEDILKQHAAFLSNAPPPIFETDPNDPLNNQALMLQLQRQLDGANINTPPISEQVLQQQQLKAQLIEQNEQHKSAFWKVHLDYNVDDLLSEMM